MIVLRDPSDVASVAHPLIRDLAALRTTQILNGETYDPAIHGYMVVVEPGDSIEKLEQEVGLPILHGLFDDVPYGHPDFSPCFEILEEHSNEHDCSGNALRIYEMVFISNDDGAATTLFVPAAEGIPGDLLAMCRSFASPAVTLP
jgi:hypothetical protein